MSIHGIVFVAEACAGLDTESDAQLKLDALLAATEAYKLPILALVIDKSASASVGGSLMNEECARSLGLLDRETKSDDRPVKLVICKCQQSGILEKQEYERDDDRARLKKPQQSVLMGFRRFHLGILWLSRCVSSTATIAVDQPTT